MGVLPEGFLPPSWSARPPTWDGLLLETSGGVSGIDVPTKQGLIAGPIARLRPGVAIETARAEILRVLSSVDPRVHVEVASSLRVTSLRAAVFEQEGPAAALLFGATAYCCCSRA